MPGYKYNLFFVIICFFLISSSCFSQSLPDTRIRHDKPYYIKYDQRNTLKVDLADSASIIEARCYFTSSTDRELFFIHMSHMQNGEYQCSLPKFSESVGAVSYFFMIINGRKQVVITPPIRVTLAKSTSDEVLPANDFNNVLTLYRELSLVQTGAGIIDDRIRYSLVRDERELHGLRAGIYKLDDIPEDYNVMPGYFGAFEYDPLNERIVPRKGFAPNIHKNDILPKSSPLKGKSKKGDTIKKKTLVNISGNNWVGYFGRTDSSSRQNLRAVITQSGSYVSITTTKTGIGHHLEGNMNTNGDMLIYDSYDGEDWSTHYGPATATLIKIYDYVRPPSVSDPTPPLNKIILYRVPGTPGAVSARRTSADNVLISWRPSAGAERYYIYSCTTDELDSCSICGQSLDELYLDTRPAHGTVYYRVSACNFFACSSLSTSVRFVNGILIAPIYLLLH